MTILTNDCKLIDEFISTLLSGGKIYYVLLIYALTSQLYLPVLERKTTHILKYYAALVISL